MSHDDSETMPQFPEKGFYYHNKHDPDGPINNHAYEVVGVARNTEDESFVVVYAPLYKLDWLQSADYAIRPLSMFMEEVTKEGKTFPRFVKITDPVILAKLTEIRNKMYT